MTSVKAVANGSGIAAVSVGSGVAVGASKGASVGVVVAAVIEATPEIGGVASCAGSGIALTPVAVVAAARAPTTVVDLLTGIVVSVADGDSVGSGVWSGTCVGVGGSGLGDSVKVAVGSGVSVGTGVGDEVHVAVGVGDGVHVAVSVGDGVHVAVGAGVSVAGGGQIWSKVVACGDSPAPQLQPSTSPSPT